MKKYKMEDVIKEIGLPENTKWIGFAIHSVENDDFLMLFEENEYAENLTWVKFPDQAKKFKSLKKAEKIRNKFKPDAEVVWLFDIGKQIVVTQPEGYGNMPKETIH